MDDKNRELNAEELEQGAGGRIPFSEFKERGKQEMRMWKKSGKTKEEYISGKRGDAMFRALADAYWDEV